MQAKQAKFGGFDPRTATPDEWRAEAARRADRRARGLPLHDDPAAPTPPTTGGHSLRSQESHGTRSCGVCRDSRENNLGRPPENNLEIPPLADSPGPVPRETFRAEFVDGEVVTERVVLSGEEVRARYGDEWEREPGRDARLVIRVMLPWSVLSADNRKYTAVVRTKDRKWVPMLVLSREYKEAKEAAAVIASRQMGRQRMFEAGVRVRMTARMFEPDRSRMRDIVNYAKLVQDALTGVVYADDRQIDEARWVRVGVDTVNARLEIAVEAML